MKLPLRFFLVLHLLGCVLLAQVPTAPKLPLAIDRATGLVNVPTFIVGADSSIEDAVTGVSGSGAGIFGQSTTGNAISGQVIGAGAALSGVSTTTGGTLLHLHGSAGADITINNAGALAGLTTINGYQVTAPNFINAGDAVYGVDNTGATDTTAAVQAILDVLGVSGRPVTIYFPPGTYKCSNLIIYRNEHLLGTSGFQISGATGANNPALSIMTPANNSQPICLLGSGLFASRLDCTGTLIQDLEFLGNGNGTSVCAVKISNGANFPGDHPILSRCAIRNFTKGWWNQGAPDGEIEGCSFSENGYDVYNESAADNAPADGLIISQCYFYGFSTDKECTGLYSNSRGDVILGCNWDHIRHTVVHNGGQLTVVGGNYESAFGPEVFSVSSCALSITGARMGNFAAGVTGTASSSGTTVTATTGIFTSGMVGRGLATTNGEKYATITAFTDSTHVTVDSTLALSSNAITVGGLGANVWFVGSTTSSTAMTNCALEGDPISGFTSAQTRSVRGVTGDYVTANGFQTSVSYYTDNTWGTLARSVVYGDPATVIDLSNITGGAASMVITSGIGNSRALTLRTTSPSGTALDALVIDASQGSTMNGTLATSGTYQVVSGGNVVVGSNAGPGSCVCFGSNAYIANSGSDKIKLWDHTFSTAPLVQFGGETSSFPALKRNGTALESRLADDSAYAPLAASNVTVNGALIMPNAVTPASASAAGVAGTVCWDGSYIYVCVATNTWKRTAISTW